jgi:hypothetical protein
LLSALLLLFCYFDDLLPSPEVIKSFATSSLFAEFSMAKGSRKAKKGANATPSIRIYSRKNESSNETQFQYSWSLSVISLLVLVAALFLFGPTDSSSEAFLGPDYDYETPPELVAEHPRIYFLQNVLSDLECDALIAQAKKSIRYKSTSGTSKEDEAQSKSAWRTSITASLRKDYQGSTPVIDRLVKRISRAANVSESAVRNGNPLQVTQYEPGGRYLPHTDSRQLDKLDELPTTKYYDVLNNFPVHGGYPYTARFMTALCYLNDEYEDGATVFPLARKDGSYKEQPSVRDLRAMQNDQHQTNFDNWATFLPPMCADSEHRPEGICIKPVKGSCALFYNHLEDEDGSPGALDGLALHAGCNVTNGHKWIANVWIEMLPKNKRKGMESEL